MKFLCSWLGCKYVITETENSWSAACKRCGKGGGHGTSYINPHGIKTYYGDMNTLECGCDTFNFPPGDNHVIRLIGGGGSGGSGMGKTSGACEIWSFEEDK